LLGVGIGNYHIVGIQELATHNAYTQVAAEIGIPAAVLYTSFIVGPLLRLRQIERETAGVRCYVRTHYLAVGLQASLVGYMIGSFFAPVAYQWGVYYLVGYAVCLRRIYEAGPRTIAVRLASRDPRTAWNAARGRIRPPPPPGRQQPIASKPMRAR
jgi:O-antigen ligase